MVRQFLIDQLRYNDNTANLVSHIFVLLHTHTNALLQYSDAYYICTIISAAACSNVSTAAPERGELLPSEVRVEHNAEDEELLKQTLTEVDRYRSMDRLIPSVHNIVTIAALEVGASRSSELTLTHFKSVSYVTWCRQSHSKSPSNIFPSHPVGSVGFTFLNLFICLQRRELCPSSDSCI